MLPQRPALVVSAPLSPGGVMKRVVVCASALVLLLPSLVLAQEEKPEKPVPVRGLPTFHTDSPRETLQTFLSAMNDYKLGVEEGDEWLESRLDEALACLDLSELKKEARRPRGRRAAIYIKEILDRLVLANDPETPIGAGAKDLQRWRVKKTLVTLARVQKGEHTGEFLFSPRTVKLAQRLYRKVQHLPYLEGSGGGALLKGPSSNGTENAALAPLKTDSPRDTIRSFMSAMNDYREGRVKNDPLLEGRIADAIACLHLGGAELLQQAKGREAVVFLKEVIDRVIVVDLGRVPEVGEDGEPLVRWRLKDTNITIVRMEEGDRRGEYLFSEATVSQSREFYDKVKTLPYREGSGQGALYVAPWLERHLPSWTQEKHLLLPNWQWASLFLSILAGLMIRALAIWVVGLLMKLAQKSENDWDNRLVASIERPIGLISAGAFWWLMIHVVGFEGTPQTVLMVLVEVLASLSLVWLVYRLADVLTDYLSSVAAASDSTLDDQLVPLLRRALHTFIVVFGLLVTVQNLGFNVLSVLAGLGLGGLAFALAAKDACANLFGSIMILADRPFQIGDWIVAGKVEGTVEGIGFRSTRIRTFYHSVISVPNAKLAAADIDNMGKRERRRIKAYFDLTYDTPPAKIEGFIEGVKAIVKANEHTKKDAFEVAFTGYGSSGLQILLYCFLEVPDWSTELVARQNMFIEILRMAETLGVEFAFPTQTLHVETLPGHTSPEETVPEIDELREAAKSFGPEGSRAKPRGLGLYVPPHQDPDLVALKRGDSGVADEGE